MAWIIRKSGNDYLEVFDLDELRASICFRQNRWHVSMVNPQASAFDWAGNSLDQAVGYVRGIERAAEVHHIETQPKPRRAARR